MWPYFILHKQKKIQKIFSDRHMYTVPILLAQLYCTYLLFICYCFAIFSTLREKKPFTVYFCPDRQKLFWYTFMYVITGFILNTTY